MHSKPHVPSHVARVAPAGTAHGTQLFAPQAFTSITDGHEPLHACVPPGQSTTHEAAASMHLPLHSFLFASHAPPHIVPSQVAIPSTGAWQGVHDLPHVRKSSSRTHPPGHMCCPSGQPVMPSPSAPASRTSVVPTSSEASCKSLSFR